jgi:hypothetical protein
MGEKESEPFQFTFDGFLKVGLQGSRVTSDAGLIYGRSVRETWVSACSSGRNSGRGGERHEVQSSRQEHFDQEKWKRRRMSLLLRSQIGNVRWQRTRGLTNSSAVSRHPASLSKATWSGRVRWMRFHAYASSGIPEEEGNAMRTFVLTIMLAFVGHSTTPQQKPTEQPCTASALVGTWQLVKSDSEATAAEGSTALKHVTQTHFFVLSVDATGLASYGHGGAYTLAGGTYTESVTHGFGAPFQLLRGMNISFKCSIDKEVWHVVGEINGQIFDEHWKRVPAASAR